MVENGLTNLFTTNGYLVLEDFFSNEEISELKDSLLTTLHSEQNELLSRSRGFYSGILNQKINVWQHNDKVKKIISDKRIVEVVKQLLGVRTLRVFQDHVLIKKKLDSKPTPWHQDFSYFPFNEPHALTIWIPFQDTNKDNGCLSYIPGSHTQGIIEKVHMYNPDKPLDKDIRPVLANLKTGSLVIHHALTLHYAYSNLTPTERIAYAIIYMANNVTFNGKRHPLTNGIGLEKGKVFSGSNFPIIN